ncbi:MAG: hypothetical protein KDA61_04180 [Planctomycetales bacterium]|nr:hypothetical protein [Planctomycetales bacterium]
MSTLDEAIQIAAAAHAGVLDKQGAPYILHPLRVMLGVEGETAQIVAVLHDVVEDTDVSFDDIQLAGFSDDVVDALRLVTHASDVSYADYVVACQANPIARAVKISDLRDNSRLERLLMRPDQLGRDAARIQRYALSYSFLSGQIDEATYRQGMDVQPSPD